MVRVGSLIRRPPVTCPPSTPIAEAADLMTRERISSLLIPHAEGLGILTDRDLRTRVIARRQDLEVPVSDVMTSRARTIVASAMVGEVVLTMLEGGFHHLPVVDDAGRLMGVVTDTDVMGLGRDSPFLLKRSIQDAGDAPGAIAVARELPRVVGSMVQAGVDPIDVGYAVALITDALTKRFIELALERLGDAPASWAWLALGSEARREQGLHSDQDHAIAFDPVGAGDDVDAFFADLAKSVTANLEASGIPRCRGGAMSTEREFRQPLEHWVKAFREWVADVGAEGSIQGSIVFDFRRIAGTLDAAESLDDVLHEGSRNPGFAVHLAWRALNTGPPLGLFDRLVTERRGAHAGTIDIKHRGLLIITAIARASALPRGVLAKSTLDRLRAVARLGGMDEDVAGDLEEAFRFLWGVRLRHQTTMALRGSEPDDHVDPRTLGAVTRRGLREAFRVIERVQHILALELGLPIRRRLRGRSA